jgi:oligosaccharide repeat unit polymerase
MDFDYGLICVVINAFLYIFTLLISFKYFNNIVSFIVLTYAISATVGIFEYSSRVNEWNITITPYIYFYFIFIIIISPIIKFKETNININNYDIPKFVLFFIFLLISYLIIRNILGIINREYLGIGYSMSDIYTETRTSAYSYTNRGLNTSIFSLINFISGLFNYLSVFIVSYLLSLNKLRLKNLVIEVFLFSIIITVLSSLLGADRSQTIRYCIYFISAYFIFRGKIKIPKYIKYQLIFIFIIAFSLFSIITISRFENKASSKIDNSVQYSIINYASQGMLHFNAHFFKNETYCTYGDYTASFIRFLLGKKYSRTFNDADENWNLSDPNVSGHVFNTFFGPFLLDYGKWLAPVIMLLMSLFVRYFVQWNNLRLDSLLILYLYVVMVIFGIIAYQYAYFFGSLNLLIYLIIAIIIRIKNNINNHSVN